MKKTIALVCAALTAAAFPFSVYAAAHDLDGNGQFNRNDCAVLTDYLLTNRRDIASQEADRDADYCLTAKDLTLMKREILRGGQQNPNPQNPEVHVNASEYMEKVRSSFVLDVPQDILQCKGRRAPAYHLFFYEGEQGEGRIHLDTARIRSGAAVSGVLCQSRHTGQRILHAR